MSTKSEKIDDLLKSGDLIESLFHTTDIGIAIVDRKGNHVRTNIGYTSMLGYRPNELVGKPISLITSTSIRKSRELLTKLFKGEVGVAERPVIKKDGETIFVLRTANVLKLKNGKLNLLITIRDITQEKKYKNLLQNTEKVAGIAGWELDLTSGKITRTDELYHIFEIDQIELDKLSLERKLAKLYNENSRPQFRKVYKEAVEKGRAFDQEFSIICGTGRQKWIKLTCRPERVENKTVKLVGTVQDITKQKDTAQQLERLSLVASKTNNAVFITDEKGLTVWTNESVERLTGFKGSDFIGRTPGSLLQGADTDKKAVDRIRKQLKRHSRVSEIIKNYKKDGKPFWISIDIAPVFKNGKLENYIGICVDVSELIHARETEKARELLEKQQVLFNSIAKNFPDGIIGVLDNKLHYVFAGGAELDKLGLAPGFLIGQNIFDHLSHKSNVEANPLLKKTLNGEAMNFEARMRNQIYSVSAVPLQEDKSKNKQILIVMYNITQRKKAEEEVIEALKQQRELNELKSKFVSIASHEFRTPLSAILSSTFLISKYVKSGDDEKTQKHVNRIVTAIHGLTDILNDFLSLGRIEEGRLSNNISEFDIVEFCESLADEIQPTLKKSQTIVFHHHGECRLVSLDRQHLKNVMVNLLSNAAKYSSEGKTIWLNSTILNGQVEILIKDEGIGIPATDQPRLFQTFFRAHNAAHIQGTGMGLHIVKRFLDLMGGTIQFSSEENKGSEFTVLFPAAAR